MYKQTDKQTEFFFWIRALLLFLNPPQLFFFNIFNVQTQFFYCFIICIEHHGVPRQTWLAHSTAPPPGFDPPVTVQALLNQGLTTKVGIQEGSSNTYLKNYLLYNLFHENNNKYTFYIITNEVALTFALRFIYLKQQCVRSFVKRHGVTSQAHAH